MKRPWLAFVLSLLLPGAGLAYLGKWIWAAVNFCLVTGIIVLVAFTQPEERLFDYIHYLILMLAAGSGGLAHAWAQRLNAAERQENEAEFPKNA